MTGIYSVGGGAELAFRWLEHPIMMDPLLT